MSTENKSWELEHVRLIDDVINKLNDDVVKKDADAVLILKQVFFYVCCSVMILIVVTLICSLYCILKYKIPNGDVPFVIEFVTLISSFTASFMMLMKIITKNLFTVRPQKTIVKLSNSIAKLIQNPKKEKQKRKKDKDNGNDK